MDYRNRLTEIEGRIAAACARAGRDPQEVRIVAVTKYVGVPETEALIVAGQTDLGENRLQVAQPKLDAITADVRWHYIGSLQTNKVKDVIGRFALLHSLDRLSLAKEIQKRALQQGITVPCLVQVNVSGEASKSGLAPDEVASFLKQVREMPQVNVRGYMTMAPLTDDPAATRDVFRGLRELRDKLLADGSAPETAVELSMGMSGDFEVAVEEGATLVRIGSLLVKP
ncbi:MAG TPA: YggS family pyridoxal phosphate-dependent enzyme [Bacilli bacterium]|nr:YggS family pyridoxal phosphate-dependent enzyme [Bacilli bacterium]